MTTYKVYPHIPKRVHVVYASGERVKGDKNVRVKWMDEFTSLRKAQWCKSYLKKTRRHVIIVTYMR